jgi:2-amino-4-hydroxy-6-hydroxymethyldihydropteridine diphosphokinase
MRRILAPKAGGLLPTNKLDGAQFSDPARSQAKAYLALGSNLGDSAKILHQAMARLQNFSKERIFKSSLWQTLPVDCPPGSPKFVNAVVGLVPDSGETPESLLKKLHELEIVFGRVPKKILNEPRPLDLDLIAFGDVVRHSPELILPHPRAHLRRFVLQPLNEIAPDLILPGQTRSVSELLAQLPAAESVERLHPAAAD